MANKLKEYLEPEMKIKRIDFSDVIVTSGVEDEQITPGEDDITTNGANGYW